MALRDWLKLSMCPGMGPATIARLLELAGGVDEAAKASESLLRMVSRVTPERAQDLAAGLKAAEGLVDEELRKAEDAGVALLGLDDPRYPPMLRQIHDPPPVLYVRGTLEDRDLMAVAIVGSRRCSFYGREQAERFGALLAGAGLTVISGAARGVDTAAHRGALSHPHGRTIAVLGCGVDVVYPPENEAVLRQIAERGAIVSEYALGAEPLSTNFPRRNRIISGMSRGVLVIEADQRSGALITARLAGDDHGRAVMALPGKLDNALASGPHQLIRDGATLVRDVHDVLEALGPLPEIDAAAEAPSAGEAPLGGAVPPLFADLAKRNVPPQAAPPSDPASAAKPGSSSRPARGRPESRRDARAAVASLNRRQRCIFDAIDSSAASVDDLVTRTGLEASAILSELTILSLKGLIKRVEGQSYARA